MATRCTDACFDSAHQRSGREDAAELELDEGVVNTLIRESLGKTDDTFVRTLISHIERHLRKTGLVPHDMLWGRAVYCLGIVRSDRAKSKLLELWGAIAGRLTAELKEDDLLARDSLEPLEPIVDALHFYLDDPEIRKWFEARAKEAADIPSDSVGNGVRRAVRQRCLLYEIRWDVIDTADGPIASPVRRWSREDLIQPAGVLMPASSAAGVLKWCSTLPPLDDTVTPENGYQYSHIPAEIGVREVSSQLGRQLARAIYNRYLSEKAAERAAAGTALRLWMMCLSCYLHEATLARKFDAEADDRAILKDGCTYLVGLRSSVLKTIGAKMMYTIQCYVTKTPENAALIDSLNKGAAEMLADTERLTIKDRVAHFRALIRP